MLLLYNPIRPNSQQHSLLVVEDDDATRAFLADNLKADSYEVVPASSARQALNLLEVKDCDLILLDVMLPDVDGFELCRQIRGSAVLGRTPVLFLTARSDEVDRVLGLEIGGDDYMTKPFSPRELIARVKAHLRREEMDAEAGSLATGPFRLDRIGRAISERQGYGPRHS